MQTFRVVHIKQSNYLAPSETFVHTRVINPVCSRPVPVITDHVSPEYERSPEIKFFELNRVNRFFRRLVLAIDYRLHWNLYYFWQLMRIRPQLIHAHFSGAGESCLWSAKLLRIPLLVNFYGIETKYHLLDPNWIPRYQRLYRHADAFICSSDIMKQDMVASACPIEKIHVVRCSVDRDFFWGKQRDWSPEKMLKLVSVARLHQEKGLNFLLAACSLLMKLGFTNWELRIIGIGPEQANLSRQAKETGMDSKIVFCGSMPPAGVANELRNAHLFILPSLKETQGVALQEAQATGLPVIASNTGGIPEGVLDGVTGVLIPPGSAQSIVEALMVFIENPQYISEMGMAGQRYVREMFSQENEYAQLAKIYEDLIRKF